MTHPILTLIELNAITLDLDRLQIWVDRARHLDPGNQLVQLKLDRCQNDIDERRAVNELTMYQISILN
jgi:hypothetical protein